MAKIIMVGGQKGGVGKSLITTLLATALGSKPFSHKVAVIDLDSQGTIHKLRNIDLRTYGDVQIPFAVYTATSENLATIINQLNAQYELVFIDAAGKLDTRADVQQQEIARSLMYVDLLLIPFTSGFGNFTATYEYLLFVEKLAQARKNALRPLTYKGFINQFRSRNRSTEYLLEDIAAIQQGQHPIDMMKNYLKDLSAFRDADTIHSLYDKQSNDTAKQNFAIFLTEFIDLLKR